MQKPSVDLTYYRADWLTDYTKEVKYLKSIIPAKFNCCFMHVGSTAASSISARPILDIAVGVINPLDLITVKDILVLKGYTFLDYRSNIYDLLLEKKYGTNSSFLIHVVTFEGKKWKDMFEFTQYIKNNPTVAKEYSAFKTDLLTRQKVSEAEYQKRKAEYIQKLLDSIRK